MSRNFELLQRAERDRQHNRPDLFAEGTFDTPPPHFPLGLASTAPRPGTEPWEHELAKLVQRLFLTTGVACPHLVVFSAVNPPDSRNWVAARAAEALAARIPGRICLVDANFPDPALHEYFGFDNHFGLRDALLDDSPIEDFTSHRGQIYLLSAGGEIPSELPLQPERIAPRFAELRNRFDYVLVDAPSVPEYSHACTLGQLADGVVMVLEAHSTRRDTAQRVKDDFELAGVRVLGAVLNNRTFPVPEAVYRLLP